MEAPRTKDLFFSGDAGGESRLRDNGELTFNGGAVLGPCEDGKPIGVRKERGRSGLVLGEAFGDTDGDTGVRSVGGLGDSGTFHRLASSGKSSSKSSYSASSSFIDLRLGCQEPRLTGRALLFIGARPGLFGDLGLGIGLARGVVVFGDGDRERLRLLIAVIAKEGVDGLLSPRLDPGPLP